MTVKKSTLALATALAACFVGCEWTGSAESDSWSSAYDAMNFSGTYRAVTTATNLDTNTDEEETTDNTSKDGKYYTTSETATFAAGAKIASGRTLHANVVPGSFQASAGGFVWNDDGNGGLIFGGGSAGGSSGGNSNEKEGQVELGSTSISKKSYNGKLPGNLVPGSVSIRIGGSIAFQDNGDGTFNGSGVNGVGTVNYGNGTVQFSFKSIPPTGDIVASFRYTVVEGETVITTGQNGGGAVLYPSGSWSLTLDPAITKTSTIVIHYSYYEENSAADAPLKPIAPSGGTNTGTDVSALTVSQNGQNLTITLNNGIVMTGKFTNVQQTGKVNQDTNAGYNTYNAQFQVQCDGNRFVGSLNYDLSNGYRMLNGTWTWGKSSYDVQAVGPAWLNSADQSTLSPGVITK